MPPEPAIAHAVPYLLVLFRLAGLFVFAPLLSSTMIPRKLKAVLAVMLAAAVYPMVPPAAVETANLDLIGLAPMIVTESLIGVTIGVLATLPLISLETAGVLMGQQMGFGLARVYNPELEYDADLLGQLVFYLGAGTFIALGGLETLFLAVAHTFERVPVGCVDIHSTPLSTIVGVLASGFELALRISTPVAGIITLLVITFGVVAKTMPQLHIMNVGFMVKILAGLAVFTLAAYAIAHAAGDEISHALDAVVAWADSLAARAAARPAAWQGGA